MNGETGTKRQVRLMPARQASPTHAQQVELSTAEYQTPIGVVHVQNLRSIVLVLYS